MRMIRLAIVEDNYVYLNALELYLSRVPDIEVVHITSSLHSISLLIATRPDVVIMDIDLGTDSGINGIQPIKEALPRTGVFMLTVFDDKEKMVQSMQAGASGYLLKLHSPKKIVEAIRSVHKGESIVSE